jgi:hypothetical protein
MHLTFSPIYFRTGEIRMWPVYYPPTLGPRSNKQKSNEFRLHGLQSILTTDLLDQIHLYHFCRVVEVTTDRKVTLYSQK